MSAAVGRVLAVASPGPLTVSTINVNGIRAAVKQRSTDNLGLLPWLKETEADVVCLQETRADDEQLSDALAPALADGWNVASAEPHVKGRNGVAVLSPASHRGVAAAGLRRVRGPRALPRGGYRGGDGGQRVRPDREAETDRQLEKERFMATIAARMAELHGRDAVLCGDWNIAHTENDIKNWKGNVKKAGFLPSERAWLTELLGTGWVDVVRVLHPDVAGPYSWWSWRGKAFDNDAGWRIDYHLASPTLAGRATSARVDRAELYALRWSDHSPVTVSYG